MKITSSAAGPKLHQKKTEHIQQKEELAEQLIKTYRPGTYLPCHFSGRVTLPKDFQILPFEHLFYINYVTCHTDLVQYLTSLWFK